MATVHREIFRGARSTLFSRAWYGFFQVRAGVCGNGIWWRRFALHTRGLMARAIAGRTLRGPCRPRSTRRRSRRSLKRSRCRFSREGAEPRGGVDFEGGLLSRARNDTDGQTRRERERGRPSEHPNCRCPRCFSRPRVRYATTALSAHREPALFAVGRTTGTTGARSVRHWCRVRSPRVSCTLAAVGVVRATVVLARPHPTHATCAQVRAGHAGGVVGRDPARSLHGVGTREAVRRAMSE